MSFGTRIFDSFKEANAYAKAAVLRTQKSPLVKRSNDKFEVYGEGVIPEVKVVDPDLNDAKERFVEIQSLLENSTQEIQIKNEIKKFLDVFGKSQGFSNSLVVVEDAALYSNLDDIFFALEEFVELLQEPLPKSSDDADYRSKRFIAISNQLKPHKVFARAQKEAREFTELSKKLPVTNISHQQWLHKISILNQSGPNCRLCTNEARMHIVGERGSELWKCAANNHGTRFLKGEERKFLAD